MKLERGQVPFSELVTLKTAHDVRKLRVCSHCGEMGISKNMIDTGRQWHGRCFVEKYGGFALLRLPRSQHAGLTIGDLGVDLMSKLLADMERQENAQTAGDDR